jgi:hypothetical protein
MQHVFRLLQLGDDGLGILGVGGSATQVPSQELALGKSGHDGIADFVGVLVESHVLQHHHRGEKEGSGVGEILSSNVGSGS